MNLCCVRRPLGLNASIVGSAWKKQRLYNLFRTTRVYRDGCLSLTLCLRKYSQCDLCLERPKSFQPKTIILVLFYVGSKGHLSRNSPASMRTVPASNGSGSRSERRQNLNSSRPRTPTAADWYRKLKRSPQRNSCTHFEQADSMSEHHLVRPTLKTYDRMFKMISTTADAIRAMGDAKKWDWFRFWWFLHLKKARGAAAALIV